MYVARRSHSPTKVARFTPVSCGATRFALPRDLTRSTRKCERQIKRRSQVMTTIRDLVLGSAAVLLATGAAGAADLPVKAKAVEYVRICSLYGAGFFYIPGTDTCMRVGGYLRVDTTFNGGAHGAPAWTGDLGQQNRYRDYFFSRSRMQLIID